MTADRKPDVEATVSGAGHVLTGNTDIPVPEWQPTDVVPGTTPLPVYPPKDNAPWGGVNRRARGSDFQAHRFARGFLSRLFARREPTPAQVRAMIQAQERRIDAAFNDTDAEIRRLHGLMARDGFVPDRRKSRRAQA